MVHMMKTGEVAAQSELRKGKLAAVKLEMEDPLEEEHAPFNKRSKISSSLQEQENTGFDGLTIPQGQNNPLDGPSPLGLRLRKSPSLLDLIQMRLSQSNSSKAGAHSKKEQKGTAAASGASEKLKASNFPASILRIGTWEYKSRYEGDLVAKCYFAKHKLVWEVLDGGLKNKIEIQWSDIMALKANYPDDGPGTFDVVLARQPLFFRETNPQPRKHTLWQATSDFTGGQASIHRRHFLQCPQGLLGKHFEKLIQCDPRLNFLSQQPEITLDSQYFEPRIPLFEDPSDTNSGFDLSSEERPSIFNARDVTSPSGAQSSSMNEQDSASRPPESLRRETPSPSSVMDILSGEEMRSSGLQQLKGLNNWDQIKVPGLQTSMSMSDLVSHLEHRISEKRSSNDFTLSSDEQQSLEILEDISRCLFSDSQCMPVSDEKSLMSRVNSLCCLLQRDPSQQNLSSKADNYLGASLPDKKACDSGFHLASTPSKAEEPLSPDMNDLSDVSPKPSMTRKDSVGELLMNLPRIASLPQFLFNISEDTNNQAR